MATPSTCRPIRSPTEGGEAPATEGAAPVDIAPLLASADAAAGEKVFSKCKSCHKIDGVNSTGPHLNGVIGRDIASADGFAYTAALTDLPGNWEPQEFSEFLTDPKTYAPGTKMAIALAKPEDRANLIALPRNHGPLRHRRPGGRRRGGAGAALASPIFTEKQLDVHRGRIYPKVGRRPRHAAGPAQAAGNRGDGRMHSERATARQIAADWRASALALTASAALALGLMTGLARGEEKIITSHGYSTFGDLKYPANFAHLDYVNPDAPKGGEISIWAEAPSTTSTPIPARAAPGRWPPSATRPC